MQNKSLLHYKDKCSILMYKHIWLFCVITLPSLNVYLRNHIVAQIPYNRPMAVKDTFYILIQDKINKGQITVSAYGTYSKSAASYIFGFDPSSPHAYKDASYFLDVQKKEDTVYTSIRQFNVLDPYQVMDSLTAHGRPFFRKNTFYAAFFKNGKYYVHKAKGEYAYMNYEGDVTSYKDSLYQKKKNR